MCVFYLTRMTATMPACRLLLFIVLSTVYSNVIITINETTKTHMTLTNNIGSAAATLTTIAFIPQVWKVWRTRHAADISMGMYVLFTIGVALWLTYGILIESWPIIMANSFTLALAGAVLAMKSKFG